MIMNFIRALMNLITDVINWLIDSVCYMIDALFVPIDAALPALNMESAWLIEKAGWANRWIAIDYGFGLITAFFVFVGAVILVKWILGLIPTVS